MREPWNWTKEDLDKLIGQAESIRLDFKQSRIFNEARERIAENLTREVSAFANTEGGTIVVRIGEKREGRARVASFIDDGVDIHTWSPERLQQLRLSVINCRELSSWENWELRVQSLVSTLEVEGAPRCGRIVSVVLQILQSHSGLKALSNLVASCTSLGLIEDPVQ
jgi:hypothetical protein